MGGRGEEHRRQVGAFRLTEEVVAVLGFGVIAAVVDAISRATEQVGRAVVWDAVAFPGVGSLEEELASR